MKQKNGQKQRKQTGLRETGRKELVFKSRLTAKGNYNTDGIFNLVEHNPKKEKKLSAISSQQRGAKAIMNLQPRKICLLSSPLRVFHSFFSNEGCVHFKCIWHLDQSQIILSSTRWKVFFSTENGQHSTVLLSIGENSTGLLPTVNTVILFTHSLLERYLNI